MAGSSRSVSPSSHDDQSGDQVSDHVMPPTQFWFDDYSLVSSTDSRSRTSASPKVGANWDLKLGVCSVASIFKQISERREVPTR